MNNTIKRSKYIRLGLTYSVLIFMAIIIIYPLLYVIGSSFNPGNTLLSSSIFPENPSLVHYKNLFDFENSHYVSWYINTFKVSFVTMIFSVLLVSLTAYAFSRYRFTGKTYGLMTFLVLQMVPNFSALIALYVLCQITGLLDTHLALILIYVGGAIPMNTYLMKGYLDSIPKELDESARMDGAGHLRIFWQIVMPLAKPMVSVVALFTFIGPLTDFILAKMLLRNEENYTLAVGLHDMISNSMGGNNYAGFAAGAVLIALPITIVFLSLQKYLISGLTDGGTKG